ncbi:sensor histidine kinase [Aerosakkonema sp. BLCC-F183]|uniref:sensor histidine kinase n=1 Tax=Aerosakkonema sp. BLCC-F183 TaxID=3342834 RepID=UPI0035BADA16
MTENLHQFFSGQFFSGYFIPHGHCYLWKPGLVGLHIVSDSLIALAYFLIPIELIYIIKKRKDVPFDWIFFLFGSFIICCGITHIMEIWTLWHPDYWWSGFLKAMTAGVSITTAAVMIELIPKIIAIPNPAQLTAANAALQNEIAERKQIQNALSQLTIELEKRVRERTAALERANELLQQENCDRSLAEAALRQSEAKLRSQAQELEKTLEELKCTQIQLVQTEKMSSLGQMVAGVAHEINNPINFIYANIAPTSEYIRDILETVKLYQKHYPQPVGEIQQKINASELDFIVEDLVKILASIKVGAERIKKIVNSLRCFSRLDEAEMKRVNIHDGIDSTLMILQHRLKEQPHRPAIQTIKEYGDLPPLECYAGQLNQVFMNILSNAIDAIEEREKYNVTRVQGYHPKIHIRTVLVEHKWVEIHIADNGMGMSPEVMAKIYDPFYTTKPIGYGTGLGLAISYQIIKKHQGFLQCYSEFGKGTEFVIKIPLKSKVRSEISCFEKVLVSEGVPV